MKQHSRRFLSMGLALIMILGMLAAGVVALAEDDTTTFPDAYTADLVVPTLDSDAVEANGYYHNKKFKETAEAHGLVISHHHTYGWTVTDLPPETAAWIAQQPELSDIAANRHGTIRIKSKGDSDGDEGGETTTTTKGGRSTSKNRSIKYVCPKCGAIIRATKLVNVVCGDCNVAFEIAK